MSSRSKAAAPSSKESATAFLRGQLSSMIASRVVGTSCLCAACHQIFCIGQWLRARPLLVFLSLFLTFPSTAALAKVSPCEEANTPFRIPIIDADVVFFGERHGNKESPEVFLTAVCKFLNLTKGGVRVALEFPTGLQSGLDTYLKSNGDTEALEEFLSHRFWHRPSGFQDGRSSLAMLDLIEALRVLRASAGNLASVTAFDGVVYMDQSRDAVMANLINGLSQISEDDVVLVLTGSWHARRTPAAHMQGYSPAASLIADELVTVLVLPESGDSWNCLRQGHCASSPVPEITDLSAYEERIRAEGAFDYLLPVGQVTASPPALATARSPPFGTNDEASEKGGNSP